MNDSGLVRAGRSLAQDAYLRAISIARVRSSPATWRLVLSAARNLEAARRECSAPADPPQGAPLAVSPPSPPPEAPSRAELEREWERSRGLMAQSRRIIAESRALCAAIDWFLATVATTGGAPPPEQGRAIELAAARAPRDRPPAES